MESLQVEKEDGTLVSRQQCPKEGKAAGRVLAILEKKGLKGYLNRDGFDLDGDDLVYPGVITFLPAVSGRKSSEGEADYLKYMKAFANYAVGKLSFEESSILSVPSPSAIFRQCGEVFPLFVRESYLNLINRINLLKRCVKVFSVRGTSGIGKSVFGMLWLLLEAQSGGKVIWHIGGEYFFFNFKNKQQVEVDRLNRNSAAKRMYEDGVWFIADGHYSYQFSAPCYALQVCSFHEQNHHEFSKTPGCQILYNPVWDEDELLRYVVKCKALNYETTDEKEVKRCLALLGGVARSLLQCEISTKDHVADKESKSKQLIQDAIEKFPGTVAQLLQVLQGAYVEKFSDKLVHCFTTKNCSVRRMEFASDYVKKQMFSYLMKKDKIEFRKWLENYKDDQSVGCMWGGLFETYAHQVLHQGGSFKIQNLQDNRNEEELVMNSSMEKLVFSNPKDLGRLRKESYCKPPEGFMSIDSIFSRPKKPPVFFQMFKRQNGSHGFIFDMFRQIDKAMKRPAYKLVSVVPKHLAARTKTQQYYDTNKKVLAFRSQANIHLREKITQYVLSLDFSFIEKESIWKDL